MYGSNDCALKQNYSYCDVIRKRSVKVVVAILNLSHIHTPVNQNGDISHHSSSSRSNIRERSLGTFTSSKVWKDLFESWLTCMNTGDFVILTLFCSLYPSVYNLLTWCLVTSNLPLLMTLAWKTCITLFTKLY